MMTKTESAYIELLRHALWGETVASCPVDLRDLFHLAKVQKTRPLILDTLLRSGIVTDEKLNGEIEEFKVRNVSSHLFLDRKLTAVVLSLNEAGIDSVLLKGQGLAQYYPAPYLRECGDIDLYVNAEDYQKACDIVLAGMGEREQLDLHEDGKHFFIREGKMVIEIHRRALTLPDPDEDAWFTCFSEDGLSRNLIPVEICDTRINTPADSFNAVYVFLHAWEHFKGRGIGLRHLCDWALLLHARHAYIDLNVIREALDRLHLWKAWQTFGAIAVDILGLPADEMPFYTHSAASRARKVVGILMQEGDLGKFRDHILHRRKDYYGRKLQSLRALGVKCFRLFFIFPGLAVSLFRAGVKGGISKLNNSNHIETD